MSLTKILFMSLTGLILMFASVDNRAQTTAETKRIEETVNYYFDGVAHRDIKSIKPAFHPDCKMMYVQGDALIEVTRDEWYERIRKNPPQPEARYRKIIYIDITGNAASVKAETDFPTFQVVDYLSLLKIDGQWKIVGKIFVRKEKK